MGFKYILTLLSLLAFLIVSEADAQLGFREKQTFAPSDLPRDARFGASVAVQGDLAFVGASRADGAVEGSGAVYVYRHDGLSWLPFQRLVASDGHGGDLFGRSLDIHGDVLLVGASGLDKDCPTEPSCNFGGGYVFRWDGSLWFEEQKIDPGGATLSRYGMASALYGDALAIGHAGAMSGAVSLHRFDGVTWQNDGRLTGGFRDGFGKSLDMGLDRLIVGVPGAGSVEVFLYNGIGWYSGQNLRGRVESFGSSVSIDGDFLAVGEPNGSPPKVYLFHWDGSIWTEQQVLESNDENFSNRFGESVSLRGDLLAVGAPRADRPENGEGAIYLFNHDGTMWREHAELTAAKASLQGRLGTAVAVEDQLVIGGAPASVATGPNPGDASAFEDTCWHLYGSGTPGSFDVQPRILPQGCSSLGNQDFGVLARDILADTTGMLLLGFLPEEVSLDGWTLLVDLNGPPFAILIRVIFQDNGHGNGFADIDLPVPNNPELAGRHLFMQFLVSDPGAESSVATTEGLETVIYRE